MSPREHRVVDGCEDGGKRRTSRWIAKKKYFPGRGQTKQSEIIQTDVETSVLTHWLGGCIPVGLGPRSLSISITTHRKRI